jgi:hypothetical protein
MIVDGNSDTDPSLAVQAQELGFIPHLKSCLEHPGAPVRIAACKCILSLSRSVRSLRTNLPFILAEFLTTDPLYYSTSAGFVASHPP